MTFTLALGLGVSPPEPGSGRTDSAPADVSHLPATAQGPISSLLGRSHGGYRITHAPGGPRAQNRSHGLSARFTPAGARIGLRGAELGLGLRAVGYAGALRPVRAVAARARGNRVSYHHPGVTEWWTNGPLGLEQGFTLAKRPVRAGTGRLTLALALSGGFRPELEPGGRGLTLQRRGVGLTYTGLTAIDARGHELPAVLDVDDRRLLIRVDDRDARYPLTVDPFVKAARLAPCCGDGLQRFGYSAAISANGLRTIAVGAPRTNQDFDSSRFEGVWVFEKASGWRSSMSPVTILHQPDPPSSGADGFGKSVAISEDGSRIVVGAPDDRIGTSPGNPLQGSAYVFDRPSGGWGAASVSGSKLTASDGAAGDRFGSSVAVSGARVVAGAPGDDTGKGSAYVFFDNPPQVKLTDSLGGSFDSLGTSVAMSGTTVVAGAPNDNGNKGCVAVFERGMAGWSGTCFIADPSGLNGDKLGSAVAISPDGGTIAAGAPAPGGTNRAGAAYAFTKVSQWGDHTRAKLTSSEAQANEELGAAVSVSGDRIAAGAPGRDFDSLADAGRTYVYDKPADGWADSAESHIAAGDSVAGEKAGFSVAGAGSTVLLGAPFRVNSALSQGALHIYQDSPFPDLAPIADRSIAEGKRLQFTVSASADPEAEPLTYSASNLPPGATFNPATRTFSWTPSYSQAGLYPDVTFAVEDRFGQGQSKSITITVNDVDKTAPTAKAPSRAFPATAARVSKGKVPVAIAWRAGADNQTSALDLRYDLERRTGKGPYKRIVSNVRARSVVRSLSIGKSHRFRVRARDLAGNVSAWAAASAFAVKGIQESKRAITYSGTWNRGSPPRSWGGFVEYTTAPGARATLSFKGRDIAVVMPRRGGLGSARICVDGTGCAIVDLGTTPGPKTLVYKRHLLTANPHKITVTRRTGRVDLDGFVVLRTRSP